MDAGTHTVGGVFGQTKRFWVPIYQRRYAWREEKQWLPLWNDLRRMAEAGIRGEDVRSHFMGAVVLDPVFQRRFGAIETRIVVDGQQRLTTLQILLTAFADLCDALGAATHSSELRKLTANTSPTLTLPDVERFKVWPTNADQGEFRATMLAGSPDALLKDIGPTIFEDDSQHLIPQAYLCFYTQLVGWLARGPGEKAARLSALLTVVRDKLRFVVIDLGEQDDAQMIFETLNDRGERLWEADKVKNYLFMRVQREDRHASPDLVYRDSWAQFDAAGAYWTSRVGRGRDSRPRMDDFLRDYLAGRTRSEVPVDQEYSVYRRRADDLADCTATGLLGELKKFASIYKAVDQLEVQGRVGVFLRRMRQLETGAHVPFLLELLALREEVSPDAIAAIEMLESFVVRRSLVGLSKAAYGRHFVELCRAIDGDPAQFLPRIRATLSESYTQSRRWPDDKEVRRQCMERTIGRDARDDIVLVVLEALEDTLRTAKTERLEPNQPLQIEHLMPRSWQEHWPLPEAVDPDLAAQERDTRVQTLGNLTLLTGSLNPSISNGRWVDKHKAILEHSALRMNQALRAATAWDEAAIRERSMWLADRVVQIWPGPERDA